MTVYEAVKKYNLENFDKKYIDITGTYEPFPILSKLVDTPVKCVVIYTEEKKAVIQVDKVWEKKEGVTEDKFGIYGCGVQ